jgi:hypothetical protein
MKARLDANRQVFEVYKALKPEEREAVKGMTPEETQKFLEERKLPATAGGMDTSEMLKLVDSRMRFKEEQNNNPAFEKLSPEDKQKAIDKMWASGAKEIGTHGEFNALNAALLARDELNKEKGLPLVTPEELKGFVLHNTYSDPAKNSDTVGAMARCHNCENLTSGVTTTGLLAGAEQHRDRHEHG